MIREWSKHDPSMMREWNCQSATRLATEVTFRARHAHFLLKNTTFRAQTYTPTFSKSCHEKWHLNLTKCCACHEMWHSNFTLHVPQNVTLELHPARATKCDTWTSPSAAPATKSESWSSPNAAPATKSDSCSWSSSHMKLHLQYARSNSCDHPTSPNTAPATKNNTATFQRNFPKTAQTSFPMRSRSDHDPWMIRAWSENDPRMKPSVRNPPRNRGDFSSSPRTFSIEKYNISRPNLHSNIQQILRLPRKVTLETHHVLRLPRKVTHFILYLTLLYVTLVYLTLLYVKLVYLTLLYVTLLYVTLFYLTLLYVALLYLTLLYVALLYLTLLYVTLLYVTLLYLTLLYVALLYLTLLYLTLLYLTILGCRSYIGRFSTKLPLIITDVMMSSGLCAESW